MHLFADSVHQPDNESQAIPYGDNAFSIKKTPWLNGWHGSAEIGR